MSVRVESALGPYEVHIERGAVDRLAGLVGDADRVAVIHAPAVAATARAVTDRLGLPVTLIEVPDAERAKTPEVLASCWDALAAAGLTRNDLVVGLGGGTTTDLAGFVAATWLRGVAYVSVPTTVLAMVDAAVGGKTGINLAAGKNLVGSFYEPRAVLCDLALLDTLPARDVRAGLAEVVKCGFIADARILSLVQEDLADATDVTGARFAELVERAVAVKAAVVAVDFREATSTGRQDRPRGPQLRPHPRPRHRGARRVHLAARRRDQRGHGVDRPGVARRAGPAGGRGRAARRTAGRTRAAVEVPARRVPGAALPDEPRQEGPGSRLRLVGLTQLGHPEIIDGPAEDALAAAYRELG